MSLFDSASLVVTPNGYKEDKLYAIKPSDGSGDLVVTRATTATRVNSDGLIEEMPYNLLQRSEEFNNSYWSKLASSIIANVTTSPSGNLTADKLVEDTSGSAHRFLSTAIATTNGVTYTSSIFLKSAGRNYAYVNLENSGGTLVAGNVDLTNGNVTQTLAGSISVIPFINGWYRIIFSGISVSTSNAFFQIRTSNSPIYANYTGDGTSGIFVWGAQLVTGTSAKEYFPTTDRLDVARLDYTNSSCPSILVEPQRTNVITYSEDYANAAWSKLGTITVTANQTSSPNGTISADLVLGADATSSISQIYGGSIGVVYTSSFFIKNNNSTQSQLLIRNASTVVDSKLNWTGSVLSSITNTTGITTFQSYNNGWYRIISTYTSVEAPQRPRILPTLSTNQSVYLWGSQLEAGSNATSYIPTIASAVTRNADVISKTGISDLIGQTEGTIFTEFNFTNVGTEKYIVNLKDVGSSNVISFRRLPSGEIRFVLTATTLSGITNQSTAVLPNGNYKIAYKYISGSIKLFINGSLSFTLTPTFTFGTPISIIELGSQSGALQINDSIKQLQLYKTALTDEQCISLTTL